LKKSFLTAKNTKPTFAEASAGKINAKVIAYISALCALCVVPIAPDSYRDGTLRPLRLMDFDFLNTPGKTIISLLREIRREV
jgi:hypothetical protein